MPCAVSSSANSAEEREGGREGERERGREGERERGREGEEGERNNEVEGQMRGGGREKNRKRST